MNQKEYGMQEMEIRKAQENGRSYETPILVELGNIQDLTRYDVSVNVG